MQTQKACHRVALLASDGFERSELHEPLEALRDAGVEAVIVTPDGAPARAWDDGDWADEVDADASLDDAIPSDFDGLVLPGGVINPDNLRTDERARAFVRDLVELGRPVAAICHGPWTLVDAEVVTDRRITSWPSLRTDLENAGALWVDEEVVVDGPLITSRRPSDLEAFCSTLLTALGRTPAHA